MKISDIARIPRTAINFHISRFLLIWCLILTGCETREAAPFKEPGIYTILRSPQLGDVPKKEFGIHETPVAVVAGFEGSEVRVEWVELESGREEGTTHWHQRTQMGYQPMPLDTSGEYEARLTVNGGQQGAARFSVKMPVHYQGLSFHDEVFPGKDHEFQAYDEPIIKTIQARWEDLLAASHVEPASGKVMVKFHLNHDGSVTNLKVVETTVAEIYSVICQKAVLDPAPYPPWPEEMRWTNVADYREISFTFYFDEESPPGATAYWGYDERLKQSISRKQFELTKIVQGHPAKGQVVLRFHLNFDGSVSALELVSNSVGSSYGDLCQKAVLAAAPYQPWSGEMHRTLRADYRVILMKFEYK